MPADSQTKPNSYKTLPDQSGHFGLYGGRFVAETLMPLILEVEKAYDAAKADPAFQAELDGYLEHYVGRPSPLYFAERLTEHLGGARIYFKRDELNHTEPDTFRLGGALDRPDPLLALPAIDPAPIAETAQKMVDEAGIELEYIDRFGRRSTGR